MAQEKRFGRLTTEHRRFEDLASGRHPWWSRLVEISRTDRDINIQVRGTYLTCTARRGAFRRFTFTERRSHATSTTNICLVLILLRYVEVFPTGWRVMEQVTENCFEHEGQKWHFGAGTSGGNSLQSLSRHGLRYAVPQSVLQCGSELVRVRQPLLWLDTQPEGLIPLWEFYAAF